MKKLLLGLAGVVVSLASSAQSSVVKFNPIPLVNNTISLGFEQRFTDKSSAQLTFDYSRESLKVAGMHWRSTWLGFTGEYRLYNLIQIPVLSDTDAPGGVFVAPVAGIRFFKDVDVADPDPHFDEKYTFAQAGAKIGYQWLPELGSGKRPLAVEASVGLLGGFMLKGLAEDYEDYWLWPHFKTGLVPTFNLSVGFAFGR